MKRWINGHKLRAVWTRVGADAARSKAHPHSPIYVLEETDLECADPPETHEQRLMRVERTMLSLTAEWLALTGRAEPPVPEINGPLDLLALETCAVVVRETLLQRLPWGNPKNDQEHAQNAAHAKVSAALGVLERLIATVRP